MSVTGKAPNSEKGRRYFAQLDQALCNGSWAEIPELARKTDKHAPERGCMSFPHGKKKKGIRVTRIAGFTLTARTEAQIASASHRPTSAGSTTSSSIHGLSEAVPKLQEAIGSGKATPEDVYCAKACLAEIHWVQEDPAAVLRVVAGSGAPTGAKEGQLAPLGWVEVSEAKCAFLRAAALEATGRDEDVRSVYRAAVAHFPGTRSPELRRWTERLLARACTYSFRRAEQPSLAGYSEALAAFRAWSNFWQRATHPASGRGAASARTDIPRRQVWKHYYELLSRILRHGLIYGIQSAPTSGLLLPPSTRLPGDFYVDAKSRQRAELKRVESTYESLLLNETQFPKASQSNTEVEEWIEGAAANWRILCGSDWTDQELGEGGKATLGRGMLDILYRAATKTFHSTAILRQLFTVHAALGEFDNAMHAINSYIEIVGKGKARAAKTGKHELGFDDDDTALVALAEAVTTLCKYGDWEQAKRAVELSRTVEKWLGIQRPMTADQTQQSDDNKLKPPQPVSNPTAVEMQPRTMAIAYRAMGVAQAHWSRLTYDTDKRPSLQQDALLKLQRALSYDPNDVDSAYALARVLAETQDVPAAIDVLKKVIAGAPPEEIEDRSHARERKLVPIWHVLALCLSASDGYESAAKMCEMAFHQFGAPEVLFGQQGSLSPADPTKRTRAQSGVVDQMEGLEKEALLQVKMTQLNLIELMEGTERAVDVTDELLGLFARLFGSPATLQTPSKPPPTAATTIAPPSRAGGATLRSVVGSIRPKSARNSADRDRQRQVSGASTAIRSNSSDNQPVTNAQALDAPIAITVTNENGESAEKPAHQHHHDHHLHLPFKLRHHHAGDLRDTASLRSKKSTEHLNEKPPAVPAKDPPPSSEKHDDAPILPAVNMSLSPETPGQPQQPMKEIEHSRPPTDWPPPAGHQENPPTQDVRLPAPYPASNALPVPHVDAIYQRQHQFSLLIKVWLFIAGLYLRADFYDDAGGAIDEALKLVEAFEAEKVGRGDNAEKLFSKGWGGGKSVDGLWADVYAAVSSLFSPSFTA